ncbi:hypothetical protein V1505DRAFT_219476 [Lipomyces doorenjongii]
MLRSVIRSPMSFFDTTPLGRIINRFTAEVNMVDVALARVSTNFVKNTFPIAFLYVYYQKVYLRTSRELKRLESVSRSRSTLISKKAFTVSAPSVRIHRSVASTASTNIT